MAPTSVSTHVPVSGGVPLATPAPGMPGWMHSGTAAGLPAPDAPLMAPPAGPYHPGAQQAARLQSSDDRWGRLAMGMRTADGVAHAFGRSWVKRTGLALDGGVSEAALRSHRPAGGRLSGLQDRSERAFRRLRGFDKVSGWIESWTKGRKAGVVGLHAAQGHAATTAGNAGKAAAEVAEQSARGLSKAGAKAVGLRAGAGLLKGVTRVLPFVNVGIAAADGIQFVKDLKNPDASPARKLLSAVTAATSAVSVVFPPAGLVSTATSIAKGLV